MKTKRAISIITIAIVAFMFMVTIGWATSGAKTIQLTPVKTHPNASGTALIDDRHVSIMARGLKPNAVYTVWFVNIKPKKHETGAGTAPYMFRTDQWGGGNYTAPLSEAPFGKWSMVMVVLHPDGDPKDMKNMVGALKAKL
jgi:hypothetical protein